MNEQQSRASFWEDEQEGSSQFREALPMFDLPKLILFDRDEYTSLESQYLQMRGDVPDPKTVYYRQLNIPLQYNDVDQLHQENYLTPSMMIFMLNYIYNEEALRGVSRPRVFFALFRVHNPKKQLFDQFEEWSSYLKITQFSAQKHKYFCAVVYLKNRWVLLIAQLRRKSAVIIDFKYDDAFPLTEILGFLTQIIQTSFDLDISSFEVEGVLFTAPEQADSGAYLICYLSKFINGQAFDRIKFSSRERGTVRLQVLWLLFKIRQLKPSEIDTDSKSYASRRQSQMSMRHEVTSTNSSAASKYMKYIQYQIKKQNMSVQTPEFMLKNQSNKMKGILPQMEDFQDWDFDQVEKPFIQEFGNKIADVIALLDSHMKLALLQANSREYNFLMTALKNKIIEAERKKVIKFDRQSGLYRKQYAKSVANLKDKLLNGEAVGKVLQEEDIPNDPNESARGLEQIIKDSIEEVRQGVPLSQSKFEEASMILAENKSTKKVENPLPSQSMHSQQQSSSGIDFNKTSIQSLSYLDEDNQQRLEQLNEHDEDDQSEMIDQVGVLHGINLDKPQSAQEAFADVGDTDWRDNSNETTANTIDIEQKLSGGRFTAFLNSYGNSKSYLEQYNLYYDAKKYFELHNKMNEFKINMDRENVEYKQMLLKMQNGYPKEDSMVIQNSANNHRSRSNMSNDMADKSQVFQDTTSFSSFTQPNQNDTRASYGNPNNKSKSIFVNNSISILSPNSPGVLSSLYTSSYDPTEQSAYKKLLNTKPSNFRMQPSDPVQQVSFQQSLQVVRSKTNPLQEIGKQSLEMRKQSNQSGLKITVEQILKEKDKYYRERKEGEVALAPDGSDYENKGKTLENPFKISMNFSILTSMLGKDFVAEEIVNYCLGYFQQKSILGGKDYTRKAYYKRLLILPTDFYFVLTYDVLNRRDNMHQTRVHRRNEELNLEMVRPYYETRGNIFENYDKILIPICIKHTNDAFNEIHMEYQLVVADINEKMLHLYVFTRDDIIAKELQNNPIIINIMRWFDFEYQWVFMKNFDPYNWKIVKGLTATTGDIDKIGYYIIYAVGQILLGFTKFENTTLQAINIVKQNIAQTLVKIANDYSIDKLPITDFLKYPL